MPDNTNNPTRLAVSNQKGGVGKTTDAINIAGALHDRGQDVLLWDCDPQGYLTMGVGFDDAYTADEPNQYSAMLSPDEHSLRDLILSHEEFDVVPATIDMFQLEQELVTSMKGREKLSTLMEGLEGYDFVIVDAPPSLGHLTDNALLACQNLIIPAEAEDTSIRAIDILFKQIETLESNFSVDINEEAIVVSNIDYPLDGEQKDMLQWFEQAFGEHVPIFEFRNRAAVKRAFNDGVSIFGHDEDCDQEDELRRIATYLIDSQGDLA